MPKQPKTDPPTEISPRTLLFIRHGDYKHWAAHDQKGLTPCGKTQAARAAKYLKTISGLPPIEKIISSTMVRAREIATIIHDALPKIPLDFNSKLEEGNPDYAPQTRDQFNQVYDAYTAPCQGQPATWVLITHANLIRYLICR